MQDLMKGCMLGWLRTMHLVLLEETRYIQRGLLNSVGLLLRFGLLPLKFGTNESSAICVVVDNCLCICLGDICVK